MLRLDKFRWHSGQPAAIALALLCVSAGSPSWASNPDGPKPCTSQSSSQRASANGGLTIISKSVSASTGDSIGESIGQKNNTSAEPPLADPAEGKPAAQKRVATGFCVAYFAQNLVSDQKMIWTRPLHLHALHSTDRKWLLPLGVGTLGLVAADQDIMRHFGNTPMAHSSSVSNYGLAAMVGGAASLYLRGTITNDDRSREAGFLAGEAAVNSVIVGEGMKLVFQRPRPNEAHAGTFGAGGASFPSEHALLAWSIASVIAHEYPGPLTKLLAYGAATGISDAVDVLIAILTGSFAFLVIVRYGLGLKVFPLSIYALEALITFTLLTAVRVLSRMLAETVRRDSSWKRLLLVGAGHAAQMIIRETQEVETGYSVVGCVDDNPLKKGLRVLGVPVLGPVEALAKVVRQQRIDEVLIAIPSATQTQMRRLVETCKQAGAAFRTVPEMAELIAGRVTFCSRFEKFRLRICWGVFRSTSIWNRCANIFGTAWLWSPGRRDRSAPNYAGKSGRTNRNFFCASTRTKTGSFTCNISLPRVMP